MILPLAWCSQFVFKSAANHSTPYKKNNGNKERKQNYKLRIFQEFMLSLENHKIVYIKELCLV